MTPLLYGFLALFACSIWGWICAEKSKRHHEDRGHSLGYSQGWSEHHEYVADTLGIEPEALSIALLDVELGFRRPADLISKLT